MSGYYDNAESLKHSLMALMKESEGEMESYLKEHQSIQAKYGFPIMTIKLWPVPTIALKFGISSYDQFSTFNLTDTFQLPSGYEDCIIWNLTVDLAPQFGVEPSATVVRRATQTKANLQSTNSDMLIMETDYSLTTHQVFNVYAG